MKGWIILANTTTRKTKKSGEIVSDTAQATPKNKPTIIPKDVDMGQFITVRNGYQGLLVYISKRTGEKFIWEDFGAEQEIELRELRNAKNSSKRFFEDNWFMFDDDDDWVIDFLGVRRFYKDALPIDKFDDIFTMKPDALAKRIALLSDGQKRSVAYRAKELISEKKIDSLSVIDVLEKALNIELIEK